MSFSLTLSTFYLLNSTGEWIPVYRKLLKYVRVLTNKLLEIKYKEPSRHLISKLTIEIPERGVKYDQS